MHVSQVKRNLERQSSRTMCTPRLWNLTNTTAVGYCGKYPRIMANLRDDPPFAIRTVKNTTVYTEGAAYTDEFTGSLKINKYIVCLVCLARMYACTSSLGSETREL